MSKVKLRLWYAEEDKTKTIRRMFSQVELRIRNERFIGKRSRDCMEIYKKTKWRFMFPTHSSLMVVLRCLTSRSFYGLLLGLGSLSLIYISFVMSLILLHIILFRCFLHSSHYSSHQCFSPLSEKTHLHALLLHHVFSVRLSGI